jgi:hypothetical protein
MITSLSTKKCCKFNVSRSMCFAFVLTSLVGTAENIAIAKSLILEKAASGNVLSFLTSLVECDCYRFFFHLVLDIL